VPRIVARRGLGFFQPGYGLVELALGDQISADIVVRIAKRRIDLDGAMAFGDRVVDSAHPLVRPSAICIGLGGRKDFDRFGVEFDRARELVVHVKAHRLVPQLERARARFRRGMRWP